MNQIVKKKKKKSKLSLEIGNIFKNTPKDVVTDVYKAMINNDFELFIKCNSIQDIEKYARKKGLTVEQSIEENKQMFEEGSRNMQNLDVKMSDYKITQPDDHKSREHAYVKVHYIGPEKDAEEYIEIPVHREYDKNWYIDQD